MKSLLAKIIPLESSLLRRYSRVSLLVVFITGVIVSLIISNIVRSQLIDATGRITAENIRATLGSQLTPEDFHYPLSETHFLRIRDIVDRGIKTGYIRGIKLWDVNYRVVFSTEQSVIGKKYPDDGNLSMALKGSFFTKLSDVDEHDDLLGQNQGGQDFLEVYAPILDASNQIIGVYEVYLEANTISQIIRKNYIFTWLALILGFGLLYFILLRVFRQASDTISYQSSSLYDLNNRLDELMLEKEQTYSGTIKALLKALDAKDHYTAGHSVRVADFAIAIGQSLGLSPNDLKILEETALFHDVGKIGIPEGILNKPGKLDIEEFAQIKQHPSMGASIIQSSTIFAQQAKIVLSHHERYDGLGYPSGLKGQSIPLEARILAVADTYDAITSNRPYRQGLDTRSAIAVMKECRGSQLDPVLVDTFLVGLSVLEAS